MRLFDVSFDGRGITIHQECEEKMERLTRDQKYNITLTLIICITICFVVSVLLG